MKAIAGLAIAFVMLGGAGGGLAHHPTERYVPIGKSPGLSGRFTTVGVVDSVDVDSGVFTMSDAERTYTVRCDEKTRFWLDRTKAKLTNLTGSLADCETGRRVEVKYVENDREAARADWVKIEIAAPE